jgi:hypothetical protein
MHIIHGKFYVYNKKQLTSASGEYNLFYRNM